MPTLEDLLRREDLGLRLVAGDGATRFRTVRSAESAIDAPWLGPHDLRLSDTPYARPRPVPDPLLQPPPAALAYALTPRRRELPEDLRRRAADAGIALLTIPPTVNLDRVQEAALQVLGRAAPEAIAAAASVQRHLLGALASPKPERELLERLQRLGGESLVLLSPWGDALARAGPSPWRRPSRPVTEQPEGHTRLAGRAARLLRVEVDGRLRSVLIALGDGDAPQAWLELGRSVLAMVAITRGAEASRERWRRAAVLAEWLAAPQASGRLAPRLRAAGLELDNPYLLAVAQGAAPVGVATRAALERLQQAGDELFASLGLGALSEVRGEQAVWAFAGGTPEAHAGALYEALRAAGGPPPRLALSLPRHDLTGVADAYRQALLALETVPQGGGLAHFDAFDPIAWVLQQQPEANLRAMRDTILGPLERGDDSGKLWRTLVSYLHAPEDLTRLSERLHIHVNTLRYRLRRIEALLERPLGRPDTLARLYLAEQVDTMLSGGLPEGE